MAATSSFTLVDVSVSPPAHPSEQSHRRAQQAEGSIRQAAVPGLDRGRDARARLAGRARRGADQRQARRLTTSSGVDPMPT